MPPKTANDALLPQISIIGKKLKTTMKLNAKFDTVAADMAKPLIFNGMISDTIIQQMGPKLMANEAM